MLSGRAAGWRCCPARWLGRRRETTLAVPYELLDPAEAGEIFAAHQADRLLAPSGLREKLGSLQLSPRFLPFYWFQLEGSCHYQARLGYRERVYAGVDAKGNPRYRYRTHWHHTTGQIPFSYAPEGATDKERFGATVVYGSFDHPRSYIREVAKSMAGRRAVPFESRMMRVRGELAQVEPYTMSPGFGFERVRGRVEALEYENARAHASAQAWGWPDHVEISSLSLRFERSSFKTVLMPLWLVSYKWKGAALRSFMSGLPEPVVAGPLIYDDVKMVLTWAMPGAMFGGLLGAMLGPGLLHIPPAGPLLIGAVAGSAIGAQYGQWFSQIDESGQARQMAEEARDHRQRYGAYENAAAGGSQKWHQEYEHRERRQHAKARDWQHEYSSQQQQQQQQQQKQKQKQRAPDKDGGGHPGAGAQRGQGSVASR